MTYRYTIYFIDGHDLIVDTEKSLAIGSAIRNGTPLHLKGNGGHITINARNITYCIEEQIDEPSA